MKNNKMYPQDIEKFGKGALTDERDWRDFRLELIPGAEILPESYSVRDKVGKIKTQDGSLSCVGQAAAYYAEILNTIETQNKTALSARDVYSLIYQPQGGAYIRDAFKKLTDSGIVPESRASSYEGGKPPSEQFMRQRGDITGDIQEEGMQYLAKSYITFDKKNVENYKRAIYQGNGCVVAVSGNNYLWANQVLLVPDSKQQLNWQHGILLTGWKKINNKVYFEFVNSWGEEWGDCGFGLMPEDYITQGLVSTAWTLIDRPNSDYSQIKHKIFLLQEGIKNLIQSISKFLKSRGKK